MNLHHVKDLVRLGEMLYVIMTKGFSGLRDLLNHSMQDAFYNSANRWPPPRCHYDSRQELRTTITDWGIGRSSDIPQQLLWMYGPFGVGKSAIAQSCAESLATENKLCASIFFSRPNKRNNPDRVFTSIAYQLAVKFPPIGDILDREILKDPTILTAARRVQFEELLVKPLQQITSQNVPIEGWVIILDGLDEIDGPTAEVDGRTAQAEIIDIVAKSIRERSTPFRWFILSRPESHIQRAMGADDVSSLLHSLDLPLSSQDDHDILTFFEKELDKIRKSPVVVVPRIRCGCPHQTCWWTVDLCRHSCPFHWWPEFVRTYCST